MTKNGGGLEWSRTHNSKFEVNKSAIIHFAKKSIQDPENSNNHIPIPRPKLTLAGQTVTKVSSYKYLGIVIDNQLNWKIQAQCATANTTKWILQYQTLHGN